MAASCLGSPLQFCAILQDPYISPAKRSRFALRPQQLDSDQRTVQQKNTLHVPEQKERKASTAVRRTTNSNENLTALLQSVPREKEDPCLKRYPFYQLVEQVYSAMANGIFPSQAGVELKDANLKRDIYQMVFDVMHRKF